MNWLDILFAVIIGWYTWNGLNTGLLAGLARLLGVLVGLAAALNLYRPLADEVNLKWNLVSKIGDFIPFLGKPAGGSAAGPGGAVEVFSPLAGGAGGLAAAPKAVFYGLQGIGESVTSSLAFGILDIICFFLIFLLVSKMVALGGSVAGKLSRIALLGPLDRAGGLLLGALKGCITAALLVAVLVSLQLPAAFISGGQKSTLFSLALQKSVLAPYFIKALTVFKITFPGWPV
ncbi:MAG: CvpA family protein [Actinobacteria bacterium]|nr:CvpA family protein [Actinomycetota bacterium]